MKYGIRELPPSRRDKKQVVAHLDADLVEAVHRRRRTVALTVQEILGEAINRAVAEYGRQPILKVGRERLVRRMRGLAQVQETAGTPECRAGKRRIAAWFDRADVERLAAFAREVGTKIEHLAELGLRLEIGEDEIKAARAALEEERSRAEAA